MVRKKKKFQLNSTVLVFLVIGLLVGGFFGYGSGRMTGQVSRDTNMRSTGVMARLSKAFGVSGQSSPNINVADRQSAGGVGGVGVSGQFSNNKVKWALSQIEFNPNLAGQMDDARASGDFGAVADLLSQDALLKDVLTTSKMNGEQKGAFFLTIMNDRYGWETGWRSFIFCPECSEDEDEGGDEEGGVEQGEGEGGSVLNRFFTWLSEAIFGDVEGDATGTPGCEECGTLEDLYEDYEDYDDPEEYPDDDLSMPDNDPYAEWED